VLSWYRVNVIILICLFWLDFAVGGQAWAQVVSVGHETPPSLSALAERLLDSVVNISISQTIKGSETGNNLPTLDVPEDSPFQEFFEDFFPAPSTNSQVPMRRVESLGSGFVVDSSRGFIVTNNHVIADADDIEVVFTDGTRLKADLVGKDSKTDLALLKIEPGEKQLTQVRFGHSQTAKIGDWVMAIGNPFGLGGTVTLGIISARNRNINSGPYDDFIQTDAAINRGNSGGPLFDMRGEVIGINTAIISPTGGSIGLGFAIPSELALNVIEQLKEFGEMRRGWLAIRIQPVTQEIAESLNLPKAEGALVSGRIADAQFDNSALHEGDVIIRFGDRPIKNARDLPRIVAESPVNRVVDVVVLREGEEKTVQVTLGLLEEPENKTEKNQTAPEIPEEEVQDFVLGMQLATLDEILRAEFSIAQSITAGVVITAIAPNSVADNKRMTVGTVILDINQDVVTSPAQVRARLAKLRDLGRKNALMTISEPSGAVRFVTLRLD